MASQNFTAGHATWCRSKYSYDDECSCGLDGALEGAGERQADSDARAAREAADRREKERGVVALERIADALEKLVALQRGHATECAWFSTSGLECDCDLKRARRSRNQGDDNG